MNFKRLNFKRDIFFPRTAHWNVNATGSDQIDVNRTGRCCHRKLKQGTDSNGSPVSRLEQNIDTGGYNAVSQAWLAFSLNDGGEYRQFLIAYSF